MGFQCAPKQLIRKPNNETAETLGPRLAHNPQLAGVGPVKAQNLTNFRLL
jgi:hypothetical protein